MTNRRSEEKRNDTRGTTKSARVRVLARRSSATEKMRRQWLGHRRGAMQHVSMTGAVGTAVLGHSVGELRRGRGGAVGRLAGIGWRGCAAALARE